MNRYQNQLAGLSFPINLFSVIIHVLAVFAIILSQLKSFAPAKELMLWIGIPCLVISLVIIILFKGYFMLVQHARLSAGFILLILSLIHLTALQDFGMFLNAFTSGENNTYQFLNGSDGLSGVIACIEFILAVALIIGAWIRVVSIFLFLLFAWYTHLFLLQNPFVAGGDIPSFTFGLDTYLVQELNLSAAFVFCLFMAVISLVGVIFGHKIKSNSVRLNWGIIPVYTILSAGLAIVLHWYALIFIVPISISFSLIIYRSGGRLLGNHIGSLLGALLIALTILFFQKEIGLERKHDLKTQNTTKNKHNEQTQNSSR